MFIHKPNSLQHELAKMEVCYWLKKLGCSFITEATSNSSGQRHDIVCLDTGQIFECEISPQRAKRFEGTDIIVIKLWENPNIKEIVENNLNI